MIKVAYFFLISLLSSLIQAENLKELDTQAELYEMKSRTTALEAEISSLISIKQTLINSHIKSTQALEKNIQTQKNAINELSKQNTNLVSQNQLLVENLTQIFKSTKNQDIRIAEIYKAINKPKEEQWPLKQTLSLVFSAIAAVATVFLAFYASAWKKQLKTQDEAERNRQTDYFERDVKYTTLIELLDAHKFYIGCYLRKLEYDQSSKETPEEIEIEYKVSLEQYGSTFHKYKIFFNDDGSKVTEESPAFLITVTDFLSKDHQKMSLEEQHQDFQDAIRQVSISQLDAIYKGIKCFFNRSTLSKK